MDVEEEGPVCKRPCGKKHRKSNTTSDLNKHCISNENESRMPTLKIDTKDIQKASTSQWQDEFDAFNDSDVLLAELDIESPPSPLLASSQSATISPRHKQKRPVVAVTTETPAISDRTARVKRKSASSFVKRKSNPVVTNSNSGHKLSKAFQENASSSERELFTVMAKENPHGSAVPVGESDSIADLLETDGSWAVENSIAFTSGEEDLFTDEVGDNNENGAIQRNQDEDRHTDNVSNCDKTRTVFMISKQGGISESQMPATGNMYRKSNEEIENTNRTFSKVTHNNKCESVISDKNHANDLNINVSCTLQTGDDGVVKHGGCLAQSVVTDIEAATVNADSLKTPACKTRVIDCGSLKDRLKKRLQENTGVVTPKRNVEEDIKKASLIQARLDASQIRKEGTKVDIGPFFGLPLKVQQLLETNRGISKLYDWQSECLQLQAVKEHRNLIYSLPTSGGKTLVAEILILRELLCYERDALLVLPFVSIVQEKVRTISEFATELGFMVEEYAGSKGKFPPIQRRKKKSLYIATIEKAHSLVNSLIETGRMKSLGLVVVDELHMVGEGGSRGATQESMLLKLVLSACDTQIIGMSATLNNIRDLQQFLNAEVYCNNFRPVQLKEYVKVEENLFSVNHAALDEDGLFHHEKFVTFPYTSEIVRKDPDQLLGLVLEIIPDNSCLVFCATKKNCENVAMMLSKLICENHRDLANVNKDKRKQLLKELQQDGEGKLCPVLEYAVHFGIAYHHSGLTMDERHLIEEAYSTGTLCLLTCTSTLAAGVNLPAKRVILRSPNVGTTLIKYSQYKQMTGRAGRAGIDTSGESILIIKKQDKLKVKELLAGPKDYCHSSLAYDGGKGVKFLLLSAIGLKLVTSTEAAFALMKKSLLQLQASALEIDVVSLTRESLQYLIDSGLVVQGKDGDCEEGSSTTYSLQVSSLGKATFKGSVDLTHSSQLYQDLKMAEQSLNLASHLHLLYLVTPYDTATGIQPNWGVYFDQFCKLSEPELKVTTLVGVPENYIAMKAAGKTCRKKVCELTIKRFYLTLMLWELWNQKTVWEVADRFCLSRGFVQNLLSQSSAFASCVYHFCQELEEFWAYQDLLGNFVKRLAYCVTAELIPLMEVPGVKLARAKQLYTAGFRNLNQLANAEAAALVGSVEHLSTRAAKQIIAAAKNILEEKTAALMEEVETLVSVPPSSTEEHLTGS